MQHLWEKFSQTQNSKYGLTETANTTFANQNFLIQSDKTLHLLIIWNNLHLDFGIENLNHLLFSANSSEAGSNYQFWQ